MTVSNERLTERLPDREQSAAAGGQTRQSLPRSGCIAFPALGAEAGREQNRLTAVRAHVPQPLPAPQAELRIGQAPPDVRRCAWHPAGRAHQIRLSGLKQLAPASRPQILHRDLERNGEPPLHLGSHLHPRDLPGFDPKQGREMYPRPPCQLGAGEPAKRADAADVSGQRLALGGEGWVTWRLHGQR